MMTEQEFHKRLSAIPAEVVRRILNTEIEIDAKRTLRLGEELARQCMTAARSPELSKEERDRSMRAAKRLLSQIDDSEPEKFPWQQEL